MKKYNFQWVVPFCWESDPSKKGLRSTTKHTGHAQIDHARLSIHQPIAENPTAGSLPCDHTRLWNLNVSGDLTCKPDSPLAVVIDESLESFGPRASRSGFSTNEAWISAVVSSENVSLPEASVRARVEEIEKIQATFNVEAQRFIDSIGWNTGARLPTRIVKPGWFHFSERSNGGGGFF